MNNKVNISSDNISIYRIEEKCLNCGMCLKTCKSINNIGNDCINCGQCILTCPSGALVPKYDYKKVLNYINDTDYCVVAFTAPAVRVAIGDEFNYAPGTFLEGKMVSALKKIGFDYCFDATFGADLTRAVNELENYKPYVYIKYASGYGGATVPTYSDESIDNTLTSQITAIGGIRTYDLKKANLVMFINTNRSGWTYDANTPVNTLQPRYNTMDFVEDIESFVNAGYHVAVGDIAFANGADNALMKQLQDRDLLDKLYGYAGWNTATNSTGFALGMGIVGNQISQDKRNELLLTRYLDDWVYQANVRQSVNSYLNLLPGSGDYLTIGDTKRPYIEEYGTKLMRSFVSDNLNLFNEAVNVSITMPWNRIFEANFDVSGNKLNETVLKKHLKY